MDTTCPKDFEDSDSIAAKACYYDCAYKDIGVMTKDGMIVLDKVNNFIEDYFNGHPDFQVAAKKAVAVTLDKSKRKLKFSQNYFPENALLIVSVQGSMGKAKVGDKGCDQTALQLTLMSYNHVLRNCPRFVDCKLNFRPNLSFRTLKLFFSFQPRNATT